MLPHYHLIPTFNILILHSSIKVGERNDNLPDVVPVQPVVAILVKHSECPLSFHLNMLGFLQI